MKYFNINCGLGIDYLYETILKDYPTFPKFSIFHLFLQFGIKKQ